MSETMKINLSKTFLSLKIVSIVAGALIACAVVYGNIDSRIDSIESAQNRFEGVMEERTRSMSENINRIYDIVKDWSPSGETAQEAQKEAGKKEKEQT